jgi:hypothetical protein
VLTITPPKSLRENIRWRVFLWRTCNRSKRLRELTLERCKHDFDFFVDSFVWQFNPNEELKVGPFILRKRQSEVFHSIADRLDFARKRKLKLDSLVEKSREEGASWGILALIDHRCLFWPRERFICISHTADAVDKTGDPDSLFWKIDHIHEHLPEWMGIPQGKDRIKFRFFFPRTKSVITGQACSATSTVGGRGVVFLDELGKMQWAHEIIGQTADVGPRIMCSTHYGTGTAFYQQTIRSDVHKELLHWTHNPEKSAGLYRWNEAEQQTEILDKDYPFPADYPFVRASLPSGGPFKGLRSPWYDAECIRRQSPRDVAMHLDIDPEGSGHQFFDGPTINRLVTLCEEPKWTGHLIVDNEDGSPIRLEKAPNGFLRLWIEPRRNGFPPGRYGMGGDIAAGTGATPSCLAVGDADLGEKVAEYQNAHLSPEAFAPIAAAMGRLFRFPDGREALFAFENAGGVGAAFAKKFFTLGYSNVYYQDRPMRFAGIRDKTDKPGWYPRRDALRQLMESYRTALGSRTFHNPSKSALEDTLRFVYTSIGDVKHSGETSTDDPTAARENHGDQPMADALCSMVMEILGLRPQLPEQPDKPHPGSFAYRFQRAQEAEQQNALDWV